MVPPLKTSKQRPSSNGYKNHSGKKPDPDEEYYQAKTKFVEKESDNRIGHNSIAKQLASAPDPFNTGKSGYPHEYKNKKDNGYIPQLAFNHSNNSSTTSLHTYPVFADGRNYNYDSHHRKDDPGHLRGITNQNKRFKGVIAHDGDDNKPNKGDFSWVEKEAKKE